MEVYIPTQTRTHTHTHNFGWRYWWDGKFVCDRKGGVSPSPSFYLSLSLSLFTCNTMPLPYLGTFCNNGLCCTRPNHFIKEFFCFSQLTFNIKAGLSANVFTDFFSKNVFFLSLLLPSLFNCIVCSFNVLTLPLSLLCLFICPVISAHVFLLRLSF